MTSGAKKIARQRRQPLRAMLKTTRKEMPVNALPRNIMRASQQAIAGNVGERDPIIDAIEAYRMGTDAYDRRVSCGSDLTADEELDAIADETFLPPLKALEEWDRPAISREGAIAALRFLREEEKASLQPAFRASMLAAALAFLEREEAA